MTDECMVPKRYAEKRKALLDKVNVCPHGDAAHWHGDAGDVVDSLPRTIGTKSDAPWAASTTMWLLNLGAIQ